MKEKIPWDGFCANNDTKRYMLIEGDEHSHWTADGKWEYNCGGECVKKARAYISNSNFITTNLKPMNTITSLIKKMARQEPEKTFVDIGFLDDSENITQEGKEALLQIVWNDNKAKLKELADKLNDATKK